jgi:ferritin-like metal-binding protein YciE
VFEHFNTPEEIFSFKLGSTLTAERDGVAVLETLEKTAQHEELRQLLHQHVEETRQQVQNIEQAFRLLGEVEQTAPAPTAKGLAKEGESSIRKTDDAIVDATVIAAALENEHWEIGTYQVLVANAEARGAADVARLLRENLDQEVATSKKLHTLLERYSKEGYAVDGAAGRSTAPGTSDDTIATPGGAAGPAIQDETRVPPTNPRTGDATADDSAGLAAAKRAGA